MSKSDDSLPPSGTALRQAFEALTETLTERGVRYALIGGLATIHHTRVRTTDDIDVLLAVPQVAMPGLFEALRDRGFQIDLTRNTRELRDDGLTSVTRSGVIVDLLRPVLPAFARVIDRAEEALVFGRSVHIASAESLIVLKLIAMRPQDEADIKDLLAAYAGKLDLDLVRAELDAFTKPDDPRWSKLDQWLREIN